MGVKQASGFGTGQEVLTLVGDSSGGVKVERDPRRIYWEGLADEQALPCCAQRCYLLTLFPKQLQHECFFPSISCRPDLVISLHSSPRI